MESANGAGDRSLGLRVPNPLLYFHIYTVNTFFAYHVL